MSKEQLDAVRDKLLAEQDNDLRKTVLNAFLEDAEKGAGMIINYATEKGLKLDKSPKEVIEYIGTINDEDIDIEMTPEMLACVSGGKGGPRGSMSKGTSQDPRKASAHNDNGGKGISLGSGGPFGL